jgi:hypothetical protein
MLTAEAATMSRPLPSPIRSPSQERMRCGDLPWAHERRARDWDQAKPDVVGVERPELLASEVLEDVAHRSGCRRTQIADGHVRECKAKISVGIQGCQQSRDTVCVSLDDRGIVEAIRVSERDLAGALLGPELASGFGQFAYMLAGRVVRDGVDPDVQEVLGNWSNAFDFPRRASRSRTASFS